MRNILRTLEEQVNPQHTALMVIDLQNDFCAEGGYLHRARAATGRNAIQVENNVKIADRIATLADHARRVNIPVVWIRSVYDFKYLADSHIAMRADEGCCLEGTWGSDFFRIHPEPEDLIITKHTFSGFHNTTLHEELQARGIKTLIITGVATNVCVDTTLREGFLLGYYVVVAEDCVGSGNRVGHEGTLSTVKVNFGKVVPAEQLRALFSKHAPVDKTAEQG